MQCVRIRKPGCSCVCRGMRPFSTIDAIYLKFNRIRNAFDELKNEKYYPTRLRSNTLQRFSDLVSQRKEEVAELWEKSPEPVKTLQCLRYMYPEKYNSALTKNRMYTELNIWRKLLMYKLQSARRPRVVGLYPKYVAATQKSENCSLWLVPW